MKNQMNLKEMGVSSLSKNEIKEVNGGIIPILFIAMILFSPLGTHKCY